MQVNNTFQEVKMRKDEAKTGGHRRDAWIYTQQGFTSKQAVDQEGRLYQVISAIISPPRSRSHRLWILLTHLF